ncbi:MAG: FkbM family methyltransferase [Chloroflexi bacterium CFX2]|nr:FkbM family methyltransferase [Chloroflexi bacterium CFX2]
MKIINRIESILPTKLMDVLRLWYRTFIKGQPSVLEKPSGLAIGSFGGFEIAYRSGTVDQRVINHSFDNDVIFTGVPEYQPGDDHIIIDVGAHIGTFSILASSKVKRGRVYAIEASQDAFNLLRINVALNRCSNISAHHLALADKEGSITLYHDQGNWGHSAVKRLSLSSETVDSLTLSSFMENNEINKCHFMKLNCEGSEFPILLSTTKSVLQKFGTILVMYHCDLWDNNTEDDLVSHLEASGFNCVVRNRDSKRGWIIAENATKARNS